MPHRSSMINSFGELKYYVYTDLYRIHGKTSISLFLRELLFGIGFKCCFWMRVCSYMSSVCGPVRILFPVCRLFRRHFMIKFGVQVNYLADIGPGFYIGHFGGISVSPHCKIGKNCNISQGVTIGTGGRGERHGAPDIGDNVYIGPGAKLFGRIRVGNNVAVGANAVVTKDVPDNAVVAGVPARAISEHGSGDFINRTDYSQ